MQDGYGPDCFCFTFCASLILVVVEGEWRCGPFVLYIFVLNICPIYLFVLYWLWWKVVVGGGVGHLS